MKIDNIKTPKGIYAAVVTPVNADYSPDIIRYTDHCRWLLDKGCDGLAPLGTTGEANSLGLSTKIKIIEFLNTTTIPMEKIIIGTGSTSIKDTVTVSKIALEAGAAGLLMLPPFYYRNPTESGLFNYFAAVTEQIATHNPQIFLYNIPIFTGIHITASLISQLRKEFPGIFVGIKDSAGDFSNTLSLIRQFPRLAVFSGSEVFAMQNLTANGWGCISATVNLTAPLMAHRMKNLSSDTKAIDDTIIKLRDRITTTGNISGTKAYLAVYKKDLEWQRTIPPNVATDVAPLSMPTLFEGLQPFHELIEIYGTSIIDHNAATDA